jgi:excisionase family DNA binding protein
MTMSTRQNRLDPSMLDPDELKDLVRFLSATGSPALVDEHGERLELPKPVFQQLLRVLKMMNEGRAIVMLPEEETFTTQASANFLGVSRQHLVDLLEGEEIPFHRVGTHRRVYFKDLLAYERRRDTSRRQTLDKLMKQVDDAGLYDAAYTGGNDDD